MSDPKGKAGSLKAPMELLPPVALRETAWVHGLGAKKYGRYNWRKNKVNANTYVSAIMRHLGAWQERQDLDPESGYSHLAHIAAGCNILMDAAHHGQLIDDRPPCPTDSRKTSPSRASSGRLTTSPATRSKSRQARC